jgi:hypothetical protein
MKIPRSKVRCDFKNERRAESPWGRKTLEGTRQSTKE